MLFIGAIYFIEHWVSLRDFCPHIKHIWVLLVPQCSAYPPPLPEFTSARIILVCCVYMFSWVSWLHLMVCLISYASIQVAWGTVNMDMIRKVTQCMQFQRRGCGVLSGNGRLSQFPVVQPHCRASLDSCSGAPWDSSPLFLCISLSWRIGILFCCGLMTWTCVYRKMKH